MNVKKPAKKAAKRAKPSAAAARPTIAPEADGGPPPLPTPPAERKSRRAGSGKKASRRSAGGKKAARKKAASKKAARKKAARKKAARKKKTVRKRKRAPRKPAADVATPRKAKTPRKKRTPRKRGAEHSERQGRRKARRTSRDVRALDIVPHAPGPEDRAKERVLLVNATDRDEARIALLVDGTLEEIYVEALNEKSATGNIYRGRVQNVERGIGAAFVDMGRGITGFLHAADMPLPADETQADLAPIDRLNAGDEVIVQVTRDSIGRKGPALTGRVSLPGRYLVLMPFTERSGISRRIPQGRERERVRKLLRELELPEGMGIIVRTASETTDLAALEADRDHLLSEWARIRVRAEEPGGPGVVRGESDLAERSVRDIMPGEVTRIVVDREETAGQIHRLLRIWYPSQSAAADVVGHAAVRAATAEVPLGEMNDEVEEATGEGGDPLENGEDAESSADSLKRLQVVARAMPDVELHTDDMPLFHAYNVEAQLEDAFRRSIRLPSGGSIVIDPTEALVAIDVNSGRLTDAEDPERTALVTNLEAVKEAARQLRLRDLGGLVVLDFIDMRERASRKEVEAEFRKALAHDRARIRLGRMGPFGLMVLSRQRIRRALTRVTHEECGTCGGTGRRRHVPGLGLRVLREMQARVARSRGRGGLEVRAPAEVCAWVRKHRSTDLRRIKNACSGPVTMTADDRLARDGWAMKGLAPETASAPEGSEGPEAEDGSALA